MGSNLHTFNEEEFRRLNKLTNSLTFEDVKEDSDHLSDLILKHHPDGKFKLLEDVNHQRNYENEEESRVRVRIPKFVIDFHKYLFDKYDDRVYANAVGRKVFSVFFKPTQK